MNLTSWTFHVCEFCQVVNLGSGTFRRYYVIKGSTFWKKKMKNAITKTQAKYVVCGLGLLYHFWNLKKKIKTEKKWWMESSLHCLYDTKMFPLNNFELVKMDKNNDRQKSVFVSSLYRSPLLSISQAYKVPSSCTWFYSSC